MQEIIQHPVPVALRPYVSGFVGYGYDGFHAGTHVGLPAASLTCVFDLSDGLVISGLNVQSPQRFSSVFSGLCTSPVAIHHDGHQRGIMLYLTPLGLRDLFGVPAAEIVAAVVHPHDLFGPQVARLEEALHEAPGWSSLDVLTRALLARLPDRPYDGLATDVWTRLSSSGGRTTVAALADESGWSVRHLSGRFAAETGLGPKAAGRLFRFERSVQEVGAGRGLAEVAAGCGYADQAHLAREWRELAGLAPSAWLAAEEFVPA